MTPAPSRERCVATVVTCVAGLPVLLSSELRWVRDVEDLASLVPQPGEERPAE